MWCYTYRIRAFYTYNCININHLKRVVSSNFLTSECRCSVCVVSVLVLHSMFFYKGLKKFGKLIWYCYIKNMKMKLLKKNWMKNGTAGNFEILKMQDRTFHAIYNLISLYTYVCILCVCNRIFMDHSLAYVSSNYLEKSFKSALIVITTN